MRLRVTGIGRALMLIGISLVLGGMAYSWSAATFAGWGILIAVVSAGARLVRRGAPTVHVEPPSLVRAGANASLRVTGNADHVRERQSDSSPGNDPTPSQNADAEAQATHLGRRTPAWFDVPGVLPWTWHEPGVRETPTLEARCVDLAGWWTTTSTIAPQSVTVLPSLHELSQASREARSVSAIIRGAHPLAILSDRSDAEGLREWLEGSNTRFIDWKASARFENLLEKQFVRVRELDLEVILDVGAAARRKEAEGAFAPLEVALPTVLHLLEWGRSHARRTTLVLAGDHGPVGRIDATGRDPAKDVRELVRQMPLLLPGAPEAPEDERAGAFAQLLKRIRAGAGNPGLVQSVRSAAGGHGETALFVVSALDLAPDRVAVLAQAAGQRTHRILLQVGDLEGRANDVATLERNYVRQVRRRRNAAALAARGWVTVDAALPATRKDVLKTVSARVEP